MIRLLACCIISLVSCAHLTLAFSPPRSILPFCRGSTSVLTWQQQQLTGLQARRRGTAQMEKCDEDVWTHTERPPHLCNHQSWSDSDRSIPPASAAIVAATTTTTAALATAVGFPLPALAESVISTGSLDPSRFVPVCPASDGFYRLLQGSTEAVVGKDAFVEYGPLIAGGLLRVRLELCVVESFVNEAVIPFVKQNGLSWILPFHETVETFLAGVIFALAATFILIGSTKIITIIITYTDFLIGLPCRLLGGFSYDRAMGKPVTLDIGLGPFKTRLIGPPAEEVVAEQDWSKLGVGSLVTVIVSGSVKTVGIALGVSHATVSRSGKIHKPLSPLSA